MDVKENFIPVLLEVDHGASDCRSAAGCDLLVSGFMFCARALKHSFGDGFDRPISGSTASILVRYTLHGELLTRDKEYLIFKRV